MRITFLAGYFDAFGTYCDSLLSAGDHYAEVLRLDQPEGQNLVEYAKSWRPDLIVYCGINGGPAKPDDAALRRLRDYAPTVMICPEASDRTWWWGLCAEYERNETFDLIVNIDGNRDWPGSDKGLTMLMPVDPEPWGQPILWTNRYVPCGFSGGNSNPYRAAMLSDLRDIVTWRGPDPDPDAQKTYFGYRDFMKQTRIAFNMAQHGTVPHFDPHARHVKGRVVEAGLAACALVEGKGPTSEWFVPGVDYMCYDGVSEARQHIRFLIENDTAAREMGERLRARVLAEHSPTRFWSRVIGETLQRAGAKQGAAA